MKNIVEEYIPFEHKNIDYINGSLNLARQQRQSGTLEGFMASTVIYTNLVEYLANDLLENLDHMISLLSYYSFHATFFVKNREQMRSKSPQTLGQLRNALNNYEFPDSSSFTSLLQKFAEVRNAIFHRLLKRSKEELVQGAADQQFSDLRDIAEEILDKYNTITKGITTTWRSVVTPQPKQETQTVEQLQSQIQALLEQIATLQTQSQEDKKNVES